MKYLHDRELKTLFNEGVIAGATVVPYPMESGWMILFSGNTEVYSVRTQRDTVSRNFKTLDAAKGYLDKLGFKKVRLDWS